MSCGFQKLGIYTEETTEAATEPEIVSTVLGSLSEEYFYEQKNKQLNKNSLDDINIRKAILYGIDREKIVEGLLGKYGEVSNSLFYRESDYYSPAWQKYAYDITKAKEYLKLAGYDNDNPLYLTIGADMESSSRQLIEEMIKEDLDKIGIKIWISNRESKEWFLDYLKNGKYELGIWAIYTPESEILKNYFSSEKIPPLETTENKNCNNFYWYSNDDVDVTINKIINTTLKDEKIKLSGEVQSALADDAVILPLYNRVFSVAYNKKINNIEINRLDGNFFKNIENMDITGESTPILSIEEDSVTTGESSTESLADNEFKSLVVGYQQEPYLINPLIADNTYRDYILSLIVRGLWTKNENGEFEPFLVKDVTAGNGDFNGSDDIKLSLKAKITLKDNIYWQD